MVANSPGASVIGYLPLAALGAFVCVGVLLFNRLVRSRLRSQEAWSGVKVQLKRRSDLVPNLVTTVREYAAHEQRALEAVVAARNSLNDAVGPLESEEADRAVSRTIARLVALGEAYPELKASEGFLRLQDELVDIEEKIAYARHFYNRNVLAYNTQTAVFPSRLVANLCGFRSADFFEAEEDAQLTVSLALGDP